MIDKEEYDKWEVGRLQRHMEEHKTRQKEEKGWQIVRCPNGAGLWELTYDGEWTGDTFDTRDEAEQAIRQLTKKEKKDG